MIKIKKIILISFLLCSTRSFSQVGPNLTAGAEGLAYKQGELDAQVILDIVATKKGEIKTELGKRLILNKLEGGSYAFYHYAEKNLTLLFSQAGKQVMTKELMTNSAELLLVYGLAEYMLQDISRRNRAHKTFSKASLEKDLLDMFYSQVDGDNKAKLKAFMLSNGYPTARMLIHDDVFKAVNELIKSLKGIDTIKLRTDTFNIKRYAEDFSSQAKNSFQHQALQAQPVSKIHVNNGTFLPKPEITKYLDNKSKKYLESKNDFYTPMSMFVDMIYDACINNENVKNAGMFQNGYSSEERYKALSKFWYFDKPNSKLIYNPLKKYQPRVDSLLNYLFTYYNLFKEIRVIYNDKATLTQKLNQFAFDQNGAEAMIKSLKDDFAKLKGAIAISESKLQYEDELSAIRTIQNLPVFLPSNREGNPVKHYLDLAYQIKKEIMPILATLNSRNNRYTTIIDSLNNLYEKLIRNGLALFKKDQEKFETLVFDLDNYFLLIDVINNLDQVESYDKIFKFLTGLVETFGDPRAQAVVQALTTAVDKYSTINTDENKITIDVEGMAVDTYERFAKNQHSKISMLFTVGVNHNIANGNNFKFINADSSSSGVSQFVSEKIGLKWNIVDWNRSRSFTHNSVEPKGTKTGHYKRSMHRAARQYLDPIVNNLHAIFYGSGLLYRISSLNSTEKFTKPIFGIGCGVTFFNGLDFNVSYASVNDLKFNESLWSLSFDVNITEYLSAVKKKKGN